jgi:hypothetical protein
VTIRIRPPPTWLWAVIAVLFVMEFARAFAAECDFSGCPPAYETAPKTAPEPYSPEAGVVYPLGPPKTRETPPLPSVAATTDATLSAVCRLIRRAVFPSAADVEEAHALCDRPQ